MTLKYNIIMSREAKNGETTRNLTINLKRKSDQRSIFEVSLNGEL